MALPQPKNYTVCFLRWLNKILKPFDDFRKDSLTKRELAKYFTSSTSTNFKCYLRLAIDFEMVERCNEQYRITTNGKEYIANFNPYVSKCPPTQLPSIDLTNSQKQLLLKILTNGNLTIHKVNIYWFLRFLKVTEGAWIPNEKAFSQEKLDFVNGLFGVSYKSRTMFEFLNWNCNYCEELGLVERIKTGTKYDRVYLTPLGVKVSNLFQS
jgi:hypothetical protein